MNNDFLQKVKDGYDENAQAEITYAYEFAENAYKTTEGKDISFLEHPVAVAEILIDLGMDAESLMAGLLHSVVEETEVTVSDVRQKFGNEIAEMVDGVTKLTKNVEEKQAENDLENLQAESYRKFFIAMTKDIRVLIVKLADRLHNMQTLEGQSMEKQRRKSVETLEIYAPLAGRLGISELKVKLEDLSLKYLEPEKYNYLVDQLAVRSTDRMKVVQHLRDIIADEIKKAGIHFEIKARPKHLYSIYRKMKTQNKTLDEIYDLIAIRVIVDTVQDCYAVLGVIHGKWTPMPGRVKDYIASPKPNMYQSLHTTIITEFKQIFEIQIRTQEMNAIAEYGIAAHWKYKEGRMTCNMTELDKKFSFIRKVMDVEKDVKDSAEFMEALKTNVDSDEIYVYTPKGTLINMPKGSTCIDFAYYIHSEVGNHCVGTRVNQKIAHLHTVLNNGDVCEIMTNNNSKGPSRDWLTIAQTPNARAKIRSYFKKALKDENIRLGKDLLEKEAIKKGYKLNDLLSAPGLKVVFDKYMFTDIDDMYASVGCGSIKINQVLLKLIDYYRKVVEDKEPKTQLAKQTKPGHHSSGVEIEGYDDFLIHIARCCNPVPGDKIIGYITRGRGVVVHRATCPNLKSLEKERLMDAKWNKNVSTVYNAPLLIETENSGTVIQKLTNIIRKEGLQMTAFSMQQTKNRDRMVIRINVLIDEHTDMNGLLQKMREENDIISASRET